MRFDENFLEPTREERRQVGKEGDGSEDESTGQSRRSHSETTRRRRRWKRTRKWILLASCMHAGARVVEVTQTQTQTRYLARPRRSTRESPVLEGQGKDDGEVNQHEDEDEDEGEGEGQGQGESEDEDDQAALESIGEDPSTEEWTIDVLFAFTEHKSMNYGSAVQPFSSGLTPSGPAASVSNYGPTSTPTAVPTSISTSTSTASSHEPRLAIRTASLHDGIADSADRDEKVQEDQTQHAETAGGGERGTGEKAVVISTSFYDRLLCLWTFDAGSR